MDLLQNTFNSYRQIIKSNQSLASSIETNLKKQEISNPKNYFYLVEIINPQNAYWNRKYPSLEKSEKLQKKLDEGRILEKKAFSWFRELSGFRTEQGILDGFRVNIPGIRAKFDIKLDDSIIEFKSKENIPLNKDEIFEKYPQDLEQVIFYAALDPKKPKVNYLVFMKNSEPYDLIAFKIKITKMSVIENNLKRRIALLYQGIKEDTPEILGKCRYYISDCQFKEQKLCNCGKLNSLNIHWLTNNLDISYDATLTNKLKKIKDKNQNKNYFTTLDLWQLRKRFFNRNQSYITDMNQKNNQYKLEYAIRKLREYLPFQSNPIIRKQKLIPTIHIKYQWLFYKDSENSQGIVVPYVAKAIDKDTQKSNPNNYHFFDLAVRCAIYKIDKGFIIYSYPRLNDRVQVYEVIFRDMNKFRDDIKKIIQEFQEALEKNDFSLLRPCPAWTQKNCPNSDICDQKCIK